MKRFAFALVLTCSSLYAGDFSSALIANSEKISEIKKQCGSQFGGRVSTLAENKGVITYHFALQQTEWGAVSKSCNVTITEDSSNISADGAIEYSISFVLTKHE